MNQQCKVCGEPAAGFHFGAFTCEGCKSFFGRSYNNLSSISECKNNGECVINKKNRTSCKACRLRKCLLVGMSKSGSRYGRRSNWFKIHCLLQEQQQAASHHRQKTPPPHHPALGMLGHPQHQFDPRLHHHLAAAMSHHHAHPLGRPTTKEDLLLLGLDEYKNSTSPSISSPESHNSDSSVEVSDARLVSRGGLFLNKCSSVPGTDVQQHPTNGLVAKDMFVPLPFTSLASLAPVFPHSAAAFLPAAAFNNAQQAAHNAFMFPPSSYLYHPTPKAPPSLVKITNNNNRFIHNNNEPTPVDVYNKRFFLDAVLQSQRSPSAEDDEDGEDTETEDAASPKPHLPQENPMDLSMKSARTQEERRSHSGDDITDGEDDAEVAALDRNVEDDVDFNADDDMVNVGKLKEHRSTPMDLTTRV